MSFIQISEDIAMLIPNIELSCIESSVQYQQINSELWNEIEIKVEEIAQKLPLDEISKIPAVASSRKAYKACGVDPSRYRLSAEALLRRVVIRKEIYQVNNLVDLLNLVSISTGYSIGGYDLNKISGNITFGIGKKDEDYEGIGRGKLNIDSMPVFRDSSGAFGTSTSDSVQTSVTKSTNRFLMIIAGYSKSMLLETATELAVKFLLKYAEATDIQINKIDYVTADL